MSTTTTNLGLIKPELTDPADITAMNENWDKIDEEIKTLEIEGGAVKSVNGKTGEVELTAEDVGAPTVDEMNEAIAAIPTPDVSGQIEQHNTSTTAHDDIRQLVANKAPMYSYGDTDLEAGVTQLETGKLHFVYE